MSSEDARRIVASISHTDTADVTPVADSRDEDIRDLQGIFFINRKINAVYSNNLIALLF